MNKLPKHDLDLLELICQSIYDKKGFNTITLDVRGLSSFTDYFVIAEGNVEKHVQMLSRHVQGVLGDNGRSALRAEGERDGGWIVIDYSDVVIHILTPSMRETYQLEQLWQQAEIVDVPIQVSSR